MIKFLYGQLSYWTETILYDLNSYQHKVSFINHCEVSTDDGGNCVNWHIAVLVEVYTLKSLDLPKLHALHNIQ